MRNKANFSIADFGLRLETDRRRDACPSACPGSDRAKQSQSQRGRVGGGPGREGRIVQNKANLNRDQGSATRHLSFRAKQSQSGARPNER